MIKAIIRRIIKVIKVDIFKVQSINNFYIDIYRKNGMKIGNNCSINSILPTGNDARFIEIGDLVIISCDCRLLPHDASLMALTNYESKFLFGKIVIGNNSFVGCGSIILPGVTLAKNTIVGAGSVVTKSIKDEGLIVCGNPARVVGKVDVFLLKNRHKSLNAKDMSANNFDEFIRNNEDKFIVR